MLLTKEEAIELHEKYTNKNREFAFIVTDKCNMRCPICFRDCGPENDSFLTKEEIKKMISFLDDSWCVSITGGECTLRMDLVAYIIKLCKKKGIKTRLKTNGYWKWWMVPLIKWLSPDYLCLGINLYHKQLFSWLSKVINDFASDKIKTKLFINSLIDSKVILEQIVMPESIFIVADYTAKAGRSIITNVPPVTEMICQSQGVALWPKGYIRAFCIKGRDCCTFGDIKSLTEEDFENIKKKLDKPRKTFTAEKPTIGFFCKNKGFEDD